MAISTTYIFGTLLTANGNLKILNIIAFMGMTLNLLANFILVPELFAVGSAYASLAAQFSTAIRQVFLAVRIFKFRPDYAYLGSLLVFFIGLYLINYFSKMLFENWMYNFMLMVVVALGLATILKLLNIRGFIQILKSKENF